MEGKKLLLFLCSSVSAHICRWACQRVSLLLHHFVEEVCWYITETDSSKSARKDKKESKEHSSPHTHTHIHKTTTTIQKLGRALICSTREWNSSLKNLWWKSTAVPTAVLDQVGSAIPPWKACRHSSLTTCLCVYLQKNLIKN